MTYTLVEIDHINKLPKCELRCYILDEPIESAAQKYKTVYCKEPERGWLWGKYVYFEV